MSKPNQVVPSFVSVFLLADQVFGALGTVLFDIVNTDGSSDNIYDSATGQFRAPVSGWYDIEAQFATTGGPLTEILIVRNGDTSFPVMGLVPSGDEIHMKRRIKLGLGETLRFEASGGTILANAGTVPNAKASNILFTLVKRFDDTKPF